jgi:L-amino acid N-acyltransferase YncA
MPHPPPAPKLRLATAEDIPAIQSIYAHHVLHGTGTFEIDPPSVSEMHSRFRDLWNDNYPYIVSEFEESVVGFGYAGPFRARSAYQYTVEDSVYVDPQRRGIGIGAQLLEGLVERASGLGFAQMVALIGGSENEASVALHAKLGFEMTGTMTQVGYKFDRWIDVVIMQRSLG